MNQITRNLVGSLSNDLLRVATLTQRGSQQGAVRFFREAQRWSTPLKNQDVAPYIQAIAATVSSDDPQLIDMEKAEQYLMYSVLLQNYALHQQ